MGTILSFYLRQEAHQWFHWLTKTVRNYDQWQVFTEEITIRFGPVEYHRPFGSFASLKQTSIVLQYLNKFEQLQGLLDPLPPKYLLEKFVDGLKDEIRYDVQASNPVDFREAVSLAKIYEGKWAVSRKTNNKTNI